MKKNLLIFFSIFCYGLIARAQTNTDLATYYHFEDSAKYCDNYKQYKEAIYYYKKLLTFDQFEIHNLNYENLLQIYLKLGKTDSAKYYLTQDILNAGPMEHDRFSYLTNDTIALNIDSLNNLYRFDYATYNKCYKIFRDDQALRHIITSLSRDDPKYNASIREGIFTTCDSLNFVELKQTIKDIGHLPTIREIGSRLQGIFAIIMLHHIKKDPAFWESLYKNAVNNGTTTRETFPYINDYHHYTHMQDSKETANVTYKYCEFIDFRKDPKQILEPEYPREVDKLRAEFYLPSLYMKAKIEDLKLPENYHEK